ncbi:MAG: sulfate permease [Microbacterium gubbeenense]
MLRLIWFASINVRAFMRRFMPTNILLDAIRTRRGLKWGVPAMLLTVPYLLGAATLTTFVDRGASGWFYPLALICMWNALKFAWIGPVSVAMLVKARLVERAEPRRLARPVGPLVRI